MNFFKRLNETEHILCGNVSSFYSPEYSSAQLKSVEPSHGRVWNLGLRITCFSTYESRMRTKMRKQKEQLRKFKDTEVAITFFMYSVDRDVCLQSFGNVQCHFEPTICWSLSKYCNRKKLHFYWEPQEREWKCVGVQDCVLGLGVGLHGGIIVTACKLCSGAVSFNYMQVLVSGPLIGLPTYWRLSTCWAVCRIELL